MLSLSVSSVTEGCGLFAPHMKTTTAAEADHYDDSVSYIFSSGILKYVGICKVLSHAAFGIGVHSDRTSGEGK